MSKLRHYTTRLFEMQALCGEDDVVQYQVEQCGAVSPSWRSGSGRWRVGRAMHNRNFMVPQYRRGKLCTSSREPGDGTCYTFLFGRLPAASRLIEHYTVFGFRDDYTQ